MLSEQTAQRLAEGFDLAHDAVSGGPRMPAGVRHGLLSVMLMASYTARPGRPDASTNERPVDDELHSRSLRSSPIARRAATSCCVRHTGRQSRWKRARSLSLTSSTHFAP